MITGKKGTKSLTKYISCKYKHRFDEKNVI